MVNLSEFKVSSYPDGHKHVVSDKDLKGDYTLEASIRSFDDLFLIAQIKRIHPELTDLRINYLLAARCDRRFSPGEAIDLEIVCEFIEQLKFRHVSVVKPHNQDKTKQYLDCTVIDPTNKLIDIANLDLKGNGCVIAPDAGASWVHNMTTCPVLCGDKKRDPKTGAVVGVTLTRNGLDGKDSSDRIIKEYDNFIIIDDLCDGGATFINIAKEIKSRKSEARVYLIVTHAIFSKGFEPFEGWIDGIYCTDSYKTFENLPAFVKQIKL